MSEDGIIVDEEIAEGIEAPNSLNAGQCVSVALARLGQSGAKLVTLRWIGNKESANLNEVYRKKSGATNILAFPAAPIPGLPPDQLVALGDLAICVPILEAEAQEQGKTQQAHGAHLIIHGLLHLLGYDHQTQADALEMEELETNIMLDLGFADPYGKGRNT